MAPLDADVDVTHRSTLIRGAQLADGATRDILIEDGVIVSLAEELREPPGVRAFDAGGLLALPGAIDSHVHFNEPGLRSHWEGWDTGSAAAVAGGVTTVVEMPLNASPPTTTGEAFDAKVNAARATSRVDFALWGGVIPGNREQLTPLAARGALGFKAFMSRSGSDDFPASDELTLYEAMATIAALGLPFLIHAESDTITAGLAARAQRAGNTTVRDYLDSRPAAAETEAIALLVELAAQTGCRVHIVHVSTGRGVQLVAEARARGVDITCEITSHHLVLTDADAVALGAVAKCAPPLRPAAELDLLWQKLAEDPTMFVVSDHSPAPLELKTSNDYFAVWGGIAGLQNSVEVVLSAATAQGRLPLTEVPRVSSTAAANRFGLAAKGRISPGCDGDIVLIELGPARILAREELKDRNRFSPYVGRPLTARVRATFSRGHLVYRDGELAPPGGGRLLRPGGTPAAPEIHQVDP